MGLLITAASFFVSSSCNKNDTKPCLNGGYSFSITSEWSLQKEIYNIGDTILLSSNFSKTLTDIINPSLVINYSNSIGIEGSYAFYELDTINHQAIGAVSKFDFIPVNGSIKNGVIVPNEQKSITYIELTNNYSFVLKVVAKAKGIYAFFISNLISQGIIGKNCTNASFANTLTNTNKNVNLFQYAMNRPPASQFEIDRIYCFRVQ
jgi:hypothetical protein